MIIKPRGAALPQLICISCPPPGVVVVIDPSVAGVSGDMLMCALVDAGAPAGRVSKAASQAALRLPGTKSASVGFERSSRRGVACTCIELDIDGDRGARPASEMVEAVRAASEALPEKPAAYAVSCAERLAGAESRVHGGGAAHLHEAAGADTVIDIVGCAAALDCVGAFDDRVECMPVALGGGTVEFSHGTSPCPAYAVLEILKGTGIEACGTGARAELATPTGAALIAGLVESTSSFYPPMSVESVGYGGGSRDFEGFANVLRVVRGSPSWGADSVSVLETSIDDATGEQIGAMIKELQGRVLDVSVVPAVSKKNRPSHCVWVVCRHSEAAEAAALMHAFTGTLGVRVRRTARMVAPRSEKTAKVRAGGREFEVRFKAGPGGRPPKAEFEDVRRVSKEAGISLREAESAARAALEGAR